MGLGKIWIAFFCLILIAGFFLARGGISGLQEKADALKATAQKAEETLKEWKDSFAKETAVPTQSTPEEPPENRAEESKPMNTDSIFSCILRIDNGKIGVFTAEGYLIRYLKTDVRTLPPADVAALEAGIPVRSRAELLERTEDFDG